MFGCKYYLLVFCFHVINVIIRLTVYFVLIKWLVNQSDGY